jgi:cyclophilin family peptidyl-prolyl cis-trans isomerase
MGAIVLFGAISLAGAIALADAPAAQRAGATPAPVLVIETRKGTIEIALAPADAPKSVEHLTALVRRRFYLGQRFHRVTASLVQIGDPASRDMSRRASWGGGNSGSPIGVAEIHPARKHVRGAVGLAHSGNPKFADSQFYIMKRAAPSLDGKHAIVGRVVSGMDVVDRIEDAEWTRSITLKTAGPTN